jgi:hypothetical protein
VVLHVNIGSKPQAASIVLSNLLLKHKFKDRIIKTFKTITAVIVQNQELRKLRRESSIANNQECHLLLIGAQNYFNIGILKVQNY